jgi:epsilon-lactone hydrolase
VASLPCHIAKIVIRFDKIWTLWGRMPIKMQRFHMGFMGSLAPRPRGIERRTCNADGINAEWLFPKVCRKDQLILYLHGGGYVLGSIAIHWPFVARIAIASQCPALLIDYRLAPESRFPAALEDAVTSYRWLLAQGFAPENIVIAGDSAGGGLAVATLVSLRDSGDPLPAGAMLLSPWTDLGLDGESMNGVGRKDPMLTRYLLSKMARLYLGDTDPANSLVSPIYADLTGLPPLYIQVGSCERLLDDAKRLSERAEDDGVAVKLDIWDGTFHVWHAMPWMPESVIATKKLGRFFNQVAGTRENEN